MQPVPSSNTIEHRDLLITALAAVGSFDPENEGQQLLDAVAEWLQRMTGLRSLRLFIIGGSGQRIMGVREVRVRPLVNGQPTPQSRAVVDRFRQSEKLPRDESEIARVEDTVYLTNLPAIVRGSEDPLLLELGMPEARRELWANKVSVFWPITRIRSGVQPVRPTAIWAGACEFEESELMIDRIEALDPLIEVAASQLSLYARTYMPEQAILDLAVLTERERDILSAVGEGLTVDEIAARFSVSTGTVKTYRRRLREKLNIFNDANLVKLAIRLGLTRL